MFARSNPLIHPLGGSASPFQPLNTGLQGIMFPSSRPLIQPLGSSASPFQPINSARNLARGELCHLPWPLTDLMALPIPAPPLDSLGLWLCPWL